MMCVHLQLAKVPWILVHHDVSADQEGPHQIKGNSWNLVVPGLLDRVHRLIWHQHSRSRVGSKIALSTTVPKRQATKAEHLPTLGY